MLQWIRNNLVLVAGIVLPVLLVAAFVVLQGTPRLVGDPPQHDFLVAGIRYEPQQANNHRLSFEVRDERLHLRSTPVESANAPVVQQLRLFRYSAAGNVFSEVDFETPGDLESADGPVSRILEETRALRLDKTLRSPDGYLFEFAGYRGRGGLLGELFGMGRRYDSQYVLSRDGAWLPLPNPDGNRYYYGNDLGFLGWIVGEEGAR
jgi:hypothetical protein